MKIIGIDCATLDAKIGLAFGILDKGRPEIRDATLCTRERAAASVVDTWLADRHDASLLAFDAPLGWPKPLAKSLINHRAGMTLDIPANVMFRRDAFHDRGGLVAEVLRSGLIRVGSPVIPPKKHYG